MSDAQLVNDWLAQNGGPRRFATGTTGVPEFNAEFLRAHGMDIKGGKWANMSKIGTVILIENGRRRPVQFRTFLEIVDGFRIADGLEPIVRRK